MLHFLTIWVVGRIDLLRGKDPRDRGDVPGWVMVTVMSAILVVAILAVFEPQIKSAIGHAIKSVTNSK